MSDIRIYVEGGGDNANAKKRLRVGFEHFLKDFKDSANEKRKKLRIILCGSRMKAYKSFKNSLKDHEDDISILLVDAEEPVIQTSWKHLKKSDNWTKPRGAKDEQCHLMVIMMESWIIADVDALACYYNKGFKRSAIPTHPDIESIDKLSVKRALKTATEKTQKGKYHKTRHAPELLKKLDTNIVRQKAAHCDRLFTTLETLIASS